MFAGHTEIINIQPVISGIIVDQKVRTVWSGIVADVDNKIFVKVEKGEFTNEIHKVF